jgi:hypothetical protein
MVEFEKDCGLELIKDLTSSDKTLSRIYGFILYTEQHPYISKVLQDTDFWKSLDSISGPRWPIFAVRPLKQGQWSWPKSDRNICFMVRTWDEPEVNKVILDDFGLKDSKELPLFVVFMWDDNDELNEISISIEGKTTDEVYHSLESVVKTIARAESQVLPEYKRTVNVFRNIVADINALKFKNNVISRGKIIVRISEFLAKLV